MTLAQRVSLTHDASGVELLFTGYELREGSEGFLNCTVSVKTPVEAWTASAPMLGHLDVELIAGWLERTLDGPTLARPLWLVTDEQEFNLAFVRASAERVEIRIELGQSFLPPGRHLKVLIAMAFSREDVSQAASDFRQVNVVFPPRSKFLRSEVDEIRSGLWRWAREKRKTAVVVVWESDPSTEYVRQRWLPRWGDKVEVVTWGIEGLTCSSELERGVRRYLHPYNLCPAVLIPRPVGQPIIYHFRRAFDLADEGDSALLTEFEQELFDRERELILGDA